MQGAKSKPRLLSMADDLTELTDDELRRRLAEKGFTNVAITPQTRRIYIRKLRQVYGGSVQENSPGSSVSSPGSSISSPSIFPTLLTSTVETTVTPQEPSDGVYVLIHDNTSMVSDSYSSAVKVAKSKKGTRFKRFDSKVEAGNYLSQLQTNHPEGMINVPKYDSSGLEKAKVIEKEMNPFSSIKTQEKNRMRKLMEEEKNEEFIDLVKENPKCLISSGDCPEIYHEGMRRNILHCAVDKGNLKFCEELFKIIRSEQFWEKLYPKDSLEMKDIRQAQLIDRYLNMQDGTVKMESSAKKGSALIAASATKEEEMASYIKVKTLDTPLHIASKKGDEAIVRFLMSFPAIDPNIRNYDNKTAVEIACTRMLTQNAKVKQRIIDLINAPPTSYVPVYRSPDVCTLGNVCILNESPAEKSAIVFNDDSTGSQFVVQAFAGPLSPAEANCFHKKWKTPSTAEEKKQAHQIRRSDPDRGLERIGRTLAHTNKVGWTEYWEFLGGYYDLCESEGLAKLETYLSTKTASIEHNGTTSVSSDDNSETRPFFSSRLNRCGLKEQKPLLPRKILFDSNNDHDGEHQEQCDQENPLSDHVTNLMSALSLHHQNGPDNNPAETNVSDIDITNSSPCPEVTITTPPLPDPSSSTLDQSSNDESLQDVMSTPLKNMPNQLYIIGILHVVVHLISDQPTKLDKDVYLAISDVPIDNVNYPNIYKWTQLIKSYQDEDTKLWPTPKSNYEISHRRDNIHHPPSPLLLSSPSISTYPQSPLTNHVTSKHTAKRYAQQQLTPTIFT